MAYEREHDEPHSRAYVMGQLARRRQMTLGGNVVNPFVKAENSDAFFAGYCDEHDMMTKEASRMPRKYTTQE